MNAQEIINIIATSEKKTPVKCYIKEKEAIDYGSSKVFGADDKIVFGEWNELKPILEANADKIDDIVTRISVREILRNKQSACIRRICPHKVVKASLHGHIVVSHTPKSDILLLGAQVKSPPEEVSGMLVPWSENNRNKLAFRSPDRLEIIGSL